MLFNPLWYPNVWIHFSLLPLSALFLTSSLPSHEGIRDPVSIAFQRDWLCWCFEQAAFTPSTDSVFSDLTCYHKTPDFFLVLGSYTKYFFPFCLEKFYSKTFTNQMSSLSISWVMPNTNLINSFAQNSILKTSI